ncbi:MAG: hypothetical protein AAF738_08810 [Bacteroidota bacterium]
MNKKFLSLISFTTVGFLIAIFPLNVQAFESWSPQIALQVVAQSQPQLQQQYSENITLPPVPSTPPPSGERSSSSKSKVEPFGWWFLELLESYPFQTFYLPLAVVLLLIGVLITRIGLQFQWHRKESNTSSQKTSLSMRFGCRFPKQWNDFEYMFRDLSDFQEWEINQGKPIRRVKLDYYFNYICTWGMFLWAVCWGTVKQVLFRQTK